MLTQIFCCPKCHGNVKQDSEGQVISCSNCNHEMQIIENIPILVRDKSSLEKQIESARKSARSEWYESSQITQWSGPYRHHLQKRKLYIEGVFNFLLKRSKQPLTGLDLGCGDGGNLVWLKNHLSELYGSDYNLLRLLRAAHIEGVTKLFLADVTDYPVRDNSFDVIFFNHVLEHIQDDEKALSEVYRILVPGGFVILGVPNEGAFFWLIAYKLQPKSLDTTDHVHFYTTKSLVAKCLKAGFVIQDVHPIGWGVPHWWLDEKIRGYKWVDDLFERLGRTYLPSQATSLYLVLSK